MIDQPGPLLRNHPAGACSQVNVTRALQVPEARQDGCEKVESSRYGFRLGQCVIDGLTCRRIIGLVKIDVDEAFAMQADGLERAIKQDFTDGKRPLMIIAALGTTGSTAIDPLNEIVKIAKEYKFDKCYLETMTYMKAAQGLYLKKGFEYIDGPMGNTGHYSCPVHMLKEL